MEPKQLALWSQRSDSCPFLDFIEEEDENCFSFDHYRNGYEVIGEDHVDFAKWMADIGNVGFDNIVGQATPNLNLPSFIPVVTRGSGKILNGIIPPEFVGVSLGDVVNEKTLEAPDEIRKKFGIDQKSKIVLLCFGKDNLIEKIWTERRSTFSKIASLGFDLVTGINYSIWFDQPHSERLINLKRGLIIFKEFQDLGIPAIPHIYWFGDKDILRWCNWLNSNPNVKTIAINTQTEKSDKVWQKTIKGLELFMSHLVNKEIHFLITGPSRPKRIDQVKNILPKFSIANGFCSRQSESGFLINPIRDTIKSQYSNAPRNEIMLKNMTLYKGFVEASGYTSGRAFTL